MARQSYRPSNGTEGDCFYAAFCRTCVRERQHREEDGAGCMIYLMTQAVGVNEPEYPAEWVYGDDGKPTCTAYRYDPDCGAANPRLIEEVQDRYDSLPRDPTTGRPVI